MTDASQGVGPISYLVVEFPGSKMSGAGFPILMDLVDRKIIRILDLTFITRGEDGSLEEIELSDVDLDGTFDLALFKGYSGGLLDEGDLAEAATVIEPGSSACILTFENHWALDFVDALRIDQAQLVAAGYIPQTAF